MKEITYEEWFDLISMLESLEDKVTGLLAIFIVISLFCFVTCSIKLLYDYFTK